MKAALIGYSQSGKTTIYRAASRGLAKGDVTAVPVPDSRFDAIVSQVQPKKQTPATVIIHDDLDSISGTGRPFSQKLLDDAKKVDLLIHVVRAFENPIAPFYAEVNPIRDHENIEVEMVLADLQIIENRLERLKRSLTVKNPGSTDYLEKVLFERVKPELESGKALRRLEIEEEEAQILRNYQLLSIKPVITVFNTAESGSAFITDAKVEELNRNGAVAISICGTIESELAEMDGADQAEFLASFGLSEPASNRLIKAVYDALGLITFFTAGENDTRAWPLRAGSTALKAAATIHNDIAKGFIRAEVVHYQDYQESGSLDAAYSAGKMKLEGKEYIIQDGDLLHIRNKS